VSFTSLSFYGLAGQSRTIDGSEKKCLETEKLSLQKKVANSGNSHASNVTTLVNWMQLTTVTKLYNTEDFPEKSLGALVFFLFLR
jgi:hypothetical protein